MSGAEQRRPKAEDIPALLELVAEGKSLRAACRDKGFHAPSTHTFIESDKERREQYARAKDLRAEHFQEQALTLGLAAALGQKVDGKSVDAAGLRVLLDAIKWAAARMSPKTAPSQRHVISYADLSADQRRARLMELEAELAAADEEDAEPDE